MHAIVCVRACVKNAGESERGKILVLEKDRHTGRSLLCLFHLREVKVLTVAVERSLKSLSVVGKGQDRLLLLNSLPFKLKCGGRGRFLGACSSVGSDHIACRKLDMVDSGRMGGKTRSVQVLGKSRV